MADTASFGAEESYVIVGYRRGNVCYGRLREHRVGVLASVEVDWSWVLAREEKLGDVIGFYHTHPPGMGTPSTRDIRTMRGWVSSFGKPLLCVIESGQVLNAYLYADDEGKGQKLTEIQRFPRKVIVGVQEQEDRDA